MKRIAAIGSLDTFPHLLMGCFGTLSRYSRNGDETYILVTMDARHDGMDEQESRIDSVQIAARRADISKVSFIEGFDHNTVSQNNVNLLRSYIESVNPLLIFMPARRATNPRQGVLGSCAFLACRWISNILLYEADKNPNFAPTVISNLSGNEEAIKQKSIQEFIGAGASNWHLDNSGEAKQLLYDKMEMGVTRREAFESHRLVLLSANDAV